MFVKSADVRCWLSRSTDVGHNHIERSLRTCSAV